jgi:hypothetical protein
MKTLATLAAAVLLGSIPAFASLSLLVSIEEKAAAAGAVAIGEVLALEPYRDEASGAIWTRAAIRIVDPIKGKLPRELELRYPGGRLGNREDVNGYAPSLRPGEQRLFFFEREALGRPGLVAGAAGAQVLGADRRAVIAQARRAARGQPAADFSAYPSTLSPDPAITEVAASGGGPPGLLPVGGTPGRYLAPDRGEPIRYLVDAQALPAGIQLADALQAVADAFNAWAAVTSLKFEFEGLQNFGVAATSIDLDDGRIRVQLHNLFGGASASVLGIGGSARQWVDYLPEGGWGGRVGPIEFDRSIYGYVVLNHAHSSMSSLSVFAEVLCHEIGHVLGMAHSSENVSETDPLLLGSIMFYQQRNANRGAALGSYDVPIIQQAHPIANTPPAAYDRDFYAVMSNLPLANPQVNWLQAAYDLQGDPLVEHEIVSSFEANGTFEVVGSQVRFSSEFPFTTPDEAIWATIEVRFGDGVNLSPPVEITARRLLADTFPAGAPDGLPDEWMATHFGSPAPVVGFSGPHDDPDGDGMTNLAEYLAGTDPRDANSVLKAKAVGLNLLEWTSRDRRLYSVETSTDLIQWTRFGAPVLATGPLLQKTLAAESGPRRFYRVRLE